MHRHMENDVEKHNTPTPKPPIFYLSQCLIHVIPLYIKSFYCYNYHLYYYFPLLTKSICYFWHWPCYFLGLCMSSSKAYYHSYPWSFLKDLIQSLNNFHISIRAFLTVPDKGFSSHCLLWQLSLPLWLWE